MASITVSAGVGNTNWYNGITGSETHFTIQGADGNTAIYGYWNVKYRWDGAKTYGAKELELYLRKSNTLNDGQRLYISQVGSISTSGFTSNRFTSVSYPKGSNFLLNSLSTSWTRVAVCGSTSSTITSYGSAATGKVYLTLKTRVTETSSGRTFSSVNQVIVTINTRDTKRTATFDGDDKSNYYGGTVQVPSLSSKNPYTDRGEFSIYFNPNGGTTPSPSSKVFTWSQTTTYSNPQWVNGSQTLNPGSTYTVTSNTSWKSSYSSSTGERVYSPSSLGSLPTVSKKGYIKTNEWYYSNGNIASSSDEVKNSFTLSCKWTPQNYKIKFSFDLNGGQMPEDMGKISEYEIFKTYGINSDATKTPNFTPVKLGYKFIGWSDKTKSIPPIGANSSNQGVSVSIPDSFYNAVNTEFTNNDVTLYAYWEYNYNKVDCLYYLTDDKEEHVRTDHYEYNIDTSTVDPQGDKAYIIKEPTSLRSGDYVFLGWVDIKPDDWNKEDKINNGYHGTYVVPPEKILGVNGYLVDIESPVYIKIKNFKNYNDWGGEPEVYYGIWAKTGKYMKINGSWKKVNKCFVKINGEWKIVTDIWTRDDTVTKDANTNEYWPWHHEI